MSSIREQISSALAAINQKFKTLTANECAEYANMLSSLLSTVLEKEAEAEGICNMYKLTLLQDEDNPVKSVAEADTAMRASNEWLEWKKLRALRIGVEETIRTLKKRIDVIINEERQTPR